MKKIMLGLMAIPAFCLSVSAQTKLFDGKTTNGWHTYLKKEVVGWKVVDGALQLDPQAAEGHGDLVTDGEYENYELTLEWNISKEGNSGIIFGVHEDPQFGATYLTGMEMQVLDNKDASDNKKANHLAGSLYDMIAPSKDVCKPAGEWNKVKLRKKDGQLTFWLNGTQIVDVKMGSDEWNKVLADSKFKNWKGFAQYPKGHIALQDHGHLVSYRNIKLKQL
ncbi:MULTISPECIES: DUF1080 domain-containing protein [Mucilaginibacter]|uniref:DUF1080 domain-containing protein n=2 Tax=Mucilaginibacter rubeus TaxID=2027860 RepID=A0ABX7UEP8_9SPHI|nr:MULTISPECIES: DUF1080 domain-containing protein [Mucilaginibacter]QTE43929.1 DUF1080 domain-containing protein [Mucilaginibacter rubeus]QTE50530.1 DUF1080 domain-containing protein [Mucilaginibacter rubeus]QTE55615.1 DUF1080 domain-containing protein [Mucilaginibacter rubeus]QTE64923.1 DUF1080 domain-containing protein [Mucilaginibacter rubeus]QTF63679.1 DUF1080 domain-containing protein [Mucilaginibacter rubeus]